MACKHESGEYKTACVKALGSCGTYDSIALLDKQKGFRLNRDIDQAIAGIQQIIGSGDAGWVSLDLADDEGRLRNMIGWGFLWGQSQLYYVLCFISYYWYSRGISLAGLEKEKYKK